MWQKLTRGPFLEGPEKAQQNLKPFISVLWAFIPDVLGVYTSLSLNTNQLIYILLLTTTVMQNLITVFAYDYQFEGDSFSFGWLQQKLIKEKFNLCAG